MNDIQHAQLINKLIKELNYLKSQRHTWEQNLSNLTVKYNELVIKYDRLECSLQAHAIGLQNVYNELKK